MIQINDGPHSRWDTTACRTSRIRSQQGRALSDENSDLPRTISADRRGARLAGRIGPGIVTGAADDDPSGIATYSQAGAQALASAAKIRGTAVLVGIPSAPRSYQTNKLILKEITLAGSRVHTLRDFGRTVEMVERLYRTGAFAFEKLIAAEFPLERLEEAIRLQESGAANGKILIRMGEEAVR